MVEVASPLPLGPRRPHLDSWPGEGGVKGRDGLPGEGQRSPEEPSVGGRAASPTWAALLADSGPACRSGCAGASPSLHSLPRCLPGTLGGGRELSPFLFGGWLQPFGLRGHCQPPLQALPSTAQPCPQGGQNPPCGPQTVQRQPCRLSPLGETWGWPVAGTHIQHLL